MSAMATLFDNWHYWSKRPAVQTPDGDALTYAQLLSQAEHFFPASGRERELLLLIADNSLASLVAYVAALRTERPVMLQPASVSDEMLQSLLDRYRPDWLFDPRNMAGPERLSTTAEPIHPELAVLLSTSGSTGSPKLVRLSQRNIHANAQSIAQYLNLSEQERPLTHLPLSYSYGLSVVNSHLLVGATLLLTADSMMERRFWQFCKEQRATSLPGVPYHYEMLERLRFQRMALPDLRTLTQAGGRLAADNVQSWAVWCQEQGKTFIPMYGQTEATARISYLPPEQVLAHPDCIGVPIPAGRLSLRDDRGREIAAPDTPGELVYEGPNVMLGYAQSREDLAAGAEIDLLHTGDLACVNPQGLYYIVGRLKRFIKLFGLRVNLDEVEQVLRREFGPLACCGEDQSLAVALAEEAVEEADVLARLSAHFGFHPSCVRLVRVDALPVTESGKINYRQLANQINATAEPALP